MVVRKFTTRVVAVGGYNSRNGIGVCVFIVAVAVDAAAVAVVGLLLLTTRR